MKVLLSIKPEFAKLIFEGTKKFEFRKSIFKHSDITTVVVYASSPLQKVIGEFEIEYIINERLETLWEKTRDYAGIDKSYFYQYFAKKEEGYAIKIKKATKYEKYLSLKDEPTPKSLKCPHHKIIIVKYRYNMSSIISISTI